MQGLLDSLAKTAFRIQLDYSNAIEELNVKFATIMQRREILISIEEDTDFNDLSFSLKKTFFDKESTKFEQSRVNFSPSPS